MYQVDDRDVVSSLSDAPQSSIGAPLPLVLATEHHLAVAYLIEVPLPGWDGSFVEVASYHREQEPVAIIAFHGVRATSFGPPNDEAFAGHPLAARGLTAYGAFEVEHSSWIRSLARMNEVHPLHHPSQFAGLRHFVFSFQDSILEVVAREYAITLTSGPLFALVPTMVGVVDPRSGAA